MEEPVMEARGVNGVVTLFDEKIRIRRKGISAFFTHGLQGEKDILISQLSSIQFKNAGWSGNGYIQFAFLGGRESKGGILSAGRDENTVLFKKGQQPSFDEFRQAVEEKMRASEPGQSSGSSDLDQLEKLAALRDKGIVSEDELEAKKRQLLGL